jgi:hypothetical protein
MNLKTLALLGLSSLLIASSCTKDESDNTGTPDPIPQRFVFGVRQCPNGGGRYWLLENNKLYADSLPFAGNVVFSKVPLPDSLYLLAQSFGPGFPSQLRSKTGQEQQLGCPCCVGGTPALRLEYTLDGSKYYWDVDTTGPEVPAATRSYFRSLYSLINVLP